VVDDEPLLRGIVRTSLKNSGFVVEEARSGEEAIELVRKRPFHLALLDVNLPGISGFELCQHIRVLEPQTGIVMVTVRAAEKDIVQALGVGADDYIIKPCRMGELTARCNAVLRRIHPTDAAEEGSITVGNLELDLGRRQLRKNGNVVRLTPTEFNLLALLMKNQGVALTHAKILRTIWGPEYGKEVEYLRSYMRLLRKKIENDPAHPKYLLTEPWLGYRFSAPAPRANSGRT
jgi:two-component system KDP operon response regulator KdpE